MIDTPVDPFVDIEARYLAAVARYPDLVSRWAQRARARLRSMSMTDDRRPVALILEWLAAWDRGGQTSAARRLVIEGNFESVIEQITRERLEAEEEARRRAPRPRTSREADTIMQSLAAAGDRDISRLGGAPAPVPADWDQHEGRVDRALAAQRVRR